MAESITNKKARFDYEILETLTAGVELLGFEVKAVREGKATLAGSRVLVRGGEAYVIGLTISPYQANNTPNDYDPERNRRLLLNKKEIAHLEQKGDEKGLTIVPLKLYNNGRLIKLEIGIVRGKKKTDKRETIKRRDTERELGRKFKR